MQVVSLCSETEVKGVPGKWRYDGSPTENALVELAVEAGVDVNEMRSERPRLKTRYRAEGRPFMSSLHPTTTTGTCWPSRVARMRCSGSAPARSSTARRSA
jgi:Ca2+-transporting ATPase